MPQRYLVDARLARRWQLGQQAAVGNHTGIPSRSPGKQLPPAAGQRQVTAMPRHGAR